MRNRDWCIVPGQSRSPNHFRPLQCSLHLLYELGSQATPRDRRGVSVNAGPSQLPPTLPQCPFCMTRDPHMHWYPWMEMVVVRETASLWCDCQSEWTVTASLFRLNVKLPSSYLSPMTLSLVTRHVCLRVPGPRLGLWLIAVSRLRYSAPGTGLEMSILLGSKVSEVCKALWEESGQECLCRTLLSFSNALFGALWQGARASS